LGPDVLIYEGCVVRLQEDDHPRDGANANERISLYYSSPPVLEALVATEVAVFDGLAIPILRHRGFHAPKPVTSADRGPEILVSISSRSATDSRSGRISR